MFPEHRYAQGNEYRGPEDIPDVTIDYPEALQNQESAEDDQDNSCKQHREVPREKWSLTTDRDNSLNHQIRNPLQHLLILGAEE